MRSRRARHPAFGSHLLDASRRLRLLAVLTRSRSIQQLAIIFRSTSDQVFPSFLQLQRLLSFPSLSRGVRKTATCTQIHQHRNKNELSMRWLNASDTGDAATKASATLETPPSTFTTQHCAVQDHWGVRFSCQKFAHDPILTLACIFAPTDDRGHMVNSTSSGESASRSPAQQRHSIDAPSN